MKRNAPIPMNKTSSIQPVFVEFIPEKLDAGVLYISQQYKTASHLCACGCGKEVVTPLIPTEWKLSVYGESVSLSPSIGNWSFPCQSHYWIRNNKVVWSGAMTQEQINKGRMLDRKAKDSYFGEQKLGGVGNKQIKRLKDFFKRLFGYIGEALTCPRKISM